MHKNIIKKNRKKKSKRKYKKEIYIERDKKGGKEKEERNEAYRLHNQII